MSKMTVERNVQGIGSAAKQAEARNKVPVSQSEAEGLLTREQVFEAVARLSIQDKVKLKAQLEAEFEQISRDFAKALREIGRANRHVSSEQVEKDVAEAVAAVRRERAARRA